MKQILLVAVILLGLNTPMLWAQQASAPAEKKVATQPKPAPAKPVTPTPPAPVKKPDYLPLKWSGSVEGNFSNTIGQINTLNTTLKSDVRGEDKIVKLYFGLLYLRGRSDGSVTTFQRRAEVKAGPKLTSRFYGYLQQVFEANQITLLDVGSRSSGGLGYHFVMTDTVKESIDIGASYNSEEYDNLELRKRTYSYQCSNTFYWKVSNDLELRHRYEYLPNTSDLKNFRARSDGSVRISFSKYLYGNFGIINEYDRAPASATTPKHKATILTTIGFKF